MSIGAASRGDVNVDGGQIVIDGEGAQFPGFDIGGDGFANGGTGSLTVSNGGGVLVQGNSTYFTVGSQDQGLLRITDGRPCLARKCRRERPGLCRRRRGQRRDGDR